MDRKDLARRLAREMQTTQGAAADTVDRVVGDILRQLRAGGKARLEGFFSFHPPHPKGAGKKAR